MKLSWLDNAYYAYSIWEGAGIMTSKVKSDQPGCGL